MDKIKQESLEKAAIQYADMKAQEAKGGLTWDAYYNGFIVGAQVIKENMKIDIVNKLIKELDVETEHISDGYHTFGELYEHRNRLWITLCKVINACGSSTNSHGNIVWKSKFHSDGSNFEGWFSLGMILPDNKQISYHLPNEKWEECDFATILSKAPDWDGHTSADVLQRLKEL
jgi:hypothetical protein